VEALGKRYEENPSPIGAALISEANNLSCMLLALRYYWIISKGYRLRPWKSPYIRWRMETFFGPQAEPAGARRFFHLLWRERRRLREFLRWTAAYRRV
jgi:hypothetical protein